MVVIDIDMPKSCEECKAICSRFNGNETVYYCGLTDLFIANYPEDLCEPREVNCPIKCDIKDIRAEIQEHTQRYTLARESGGMGQVDWSDYLIKADDVIKIIDKHIGGKEKE